MKNFLNIFTLAALILASNSSNAQSYVKGQTYSITKNTTMSGNNFPDQCDACVFNISEGVTLTINKEIAVPSSIFNGGIIVLNSKMSFWSAGQFNNVTVNVKSAGSIVSSAELMIKNSEFVFNGKSAATFWSPVNMNKSSMKFLDNSSMEVTSTFNLVDNSSLIAGDGAKQSNSFIKFNGGTLNEYDNSYVSLQGTNNYYFNWSAYNAAGKSYTTTNNKMNCDGASKNSCSAPVVYGPATLNFAGVASSAVLPVTLSAFGVKLTGNRVDIAWTTDMEMNSNRYEIERSIDGINWSTAGSVKSNGNASLVSRYAFTDLLKVTGTVSYRLKMVDNDESFAYSPVKTVKADAGVEMSIFPNPATDYVVINARNSDKMNIQLISQNGQVLKQVDGNGRINLSVTEFNTGNYIVRVANANGSTQSFKLVIRK